MGLAMRKHKIYLETSIFNYYFDKEREAHPYTVKLFLELAPEPKRTLMFNLIPEYSIRTLDMDIETERLAEIYVAEGIVPEKYRTDAQHIACTVVNGLDFIASLNFTHIVKRKTIEMSALLNFREGYKKVGIYSPMEVVDYE
jgi:hypothetical protein